MDIKFRKKILTSIGLSWIKTVDIELREDCLIYNITGT